MKVYLKFCLLLMIMVSMMVSCKNKEADKAAAECKIASDDLNPNGDSELAILMRAMTIATEKNTALLRENKETENYSDTLNTILTAKPSDLGLDKDIFDGFAKTYLAALNDFNNADVANKIKAHNVIVQNCKSCHEQFCRGPLKRIAKLEILE
jgi:hypothetical protein